MCYALYNPVSLLSVQQERLSLKLYKRACVLLIVGYRDIYLFIFLGDFIVYSFFSYPCDE